VPQCNYGGRVTDDHDRTCLSALLAQIYTPSLLDATHALSASGLYTVPADLDLRDTWEFIGRLPATAAPEVFGLHDNADITMHTHDTAQLCAALLVAQGGGGGGGGGGGEQDAAVEATARALLERLPEQFDLERVQAKWPVLYEESMNTVLHQELIRFNRLSAVRGTTLQLSRRACV
jgi:dynein heavy chain